MLERFVETLKTSPTTLANRGAELTGRARSRFARVASEGQETLWTFRLDALETIEDILAGAPDLPVVGRVADAAERIVHRRIESTTAVPVADYDELNTKQVGEAVRDMGRVDLLRMRRHEAGNKKRKTALAHIDRELERLDKSLNSAA